MVHYYEATAFVTNYRKGQTQPRNSISHVRTGRWYLRRYTVLLFFILRIQWIFVCNPSSFLRREFCQNIFETNSITFLYERFIFHRTKFFPFQIFSLSNHRKNVTLFQKCTIFKFFYLLQDKRYKIRWIS